jgi:hypothetical protein
MLSNFFTRQIEDQDIVSQEFERFRIRYLYYRSSETRMSPKPQETPGQDYLAWMYRKDLDTLGFVVCDGVGSSFCGDIAARYLGGKLLSDLIFEKGPLLEKVGGAAAMSDYVPRYLRDYVVDSQVLVNQREISADLPDIVRNALLKTRDEHGSESVFACGWLSFQEKRTLLHLVWMGDVTIRVFDRDGGLKDLGGQWSNKNRWSTKSGLKGSCFAWSGDVGKLQISRIMLFSDGLMSVADRLPHLSNGEVQHEVNRLLELPSSDDISFIDILIPLYQPETLSVFEKQQRSLDAPSIELQGRRFFWGAVDGAEQYVALEKASDATTRELYRGKGLECELKSHGPGLSKYRVQAWGSQGEKGESTELAVEWPTPSPVPVETPPPVPGTETLRFGSSAPIEPEHAPPVQPTFPVLPKPFLNVSSLVVGEVVRVSWAPVEGFEYYQFQVKQINEDWKTVEDQIKESSCMWKPRAAGICQLRLRGFIRGEYVDGEEELVSITDQKHAVDIRLSTPAMVNKSGTVNEGDEVELSCSAHDNVRYEWRWSNTVNDPEQAEQKDFTSRNRLKKKMTIAGSYTFWVRAVTTSRSTQWSSPMPVRVNPRPERKSLATTIKVVASQLIGLDSPRSLFVPGSLPLYSGQPFDIQCSDVPDAEKYEWACRIWRGESDAEPSSGDHMGDKTWRNQYKTPGRYSYYARAIRGQIASRWTKRVIEVFEAPVSPHRSSVAAAYQAQTPVFEILTPKPGERLRLPFRMEWTEIRADYYVIYVSSVSDKYWRSLELEWRSSEYIVRDLPHNFYSGDYWMKVIAVLRTGGKVETDSVLVHIFVK